MSKKSIEILIKTSNREKLLKLALDSLLASLARVSELDAQIIVTNFAQEELVLEDYPSVIIRHFKEKNTTIGAINNFNIKQLTKDYVFFFDDDDLVDIDFFPSLENIFLQYDDLDVIYTHKKRLMGDIITNYSIPYPKKSQMLEPLRMKSTVTEIFRTDFLHKNNLQFLEDLMALEDVVFTLDFNLHNPKIYFSRNIIYLVRRDNSTSSTSGNFGDKWINSLPIAYDYFINKIYPEYVYYLPEYLDIVLKAILQMYITSFLYFSSLKTRLKYVKEYHDSLFIMNSIFHMVLLAKGSGTLFPSINPFKNNSLRSILSIICYPKKQLLIEIVRGPSVYKRWLLFFVYRHK